MSYCEKKKKDYHSELNKYHITTHSLCLTNAYYLPHGQEKSVNIM